MDLLYKLLSIITDPIVSFLQKEGLWNDLVSIYEKLSALIQQIAGWLHINIDSHGVVSFLIEAAKLIIKLFIVLFQVLLNIATWIIHLFS